MRVLFITSTPMNVERGSGTFVGIDTLARTLRTLGWQVDLVTPAVHLPIYTAERIWFNESLRLRDDFGSVDFSVGFDLDGYALPAGLRTRPHVASIKGVIADEMRFEKGFTKATMRLQAYLEARHVKRADCVVAPSRYSASRLESLYGIGKVRCVVPELIDLEGWNRSIQQNPSLPDPGKFVVLCVCRFYPRKRVRLLLEAAGMLNGVIPHLEIRLVGGGPESGRLRAWCREKKLSNVVFRADISQSELVGEYLGCDVFCLPSVQEGFGIVFLEAMACAKPIIAARASAVPEVVQHGILTAPESAREIAEAIKTLHANPTMREELGAAGAQFVKEFDAPRVASRFASEISRFLEKA